MKRPWLLPLSPLYGLALAVKNRAYNDRRLPLRRLQHPVISIGSISAGGAGKTPVVLALADLLERSGYAVDVLSRGYGRTSAGVLKVDPAGPASDFGDEPVELAQTGLDVFVGADRYAAGIAAELSAPNRKSLIHLLDDGFQHRRLARTVELVVLTLADLHDHLLPAGNLREPFTAIRRADAVVLREEEAEALTPYLHGKPAWLVRRTLVLPAALPARPFAFCALARPEAFFNDLAKAGAQVAGELTFPDHHHYTPADMHRLTTAARAAGATAFLTTAKDAVKLTPDLLATLATVGPTITARLETRFLHEQDVILPQLRLALNNHRAHCIAASTGSE